MVGFLKHHQGGIIRGKQIRSTCNCNDCTKFLWPRKCRSKSFIFFLWLILIAALAGPSVAEILDDYPASGKQYSPSYQSFTSGLNSISLDDAVNYNLATNGYAMPLVYNRQLMSNLYNVNDEAKQ